MKGSEVKKELSLLIMIEVKQGQRQKQIDAYNKLLPLVSKEEGCLQYELKAVSGNKDQFVLVERWASEEALGLHDNMPYMIEADKISPTFRAKPASVIKLENINL